MKKIFLTTVLVLALFSTGYVAHADLDCSTVNAENYSLCCDQAVGGEGVAANDEQCSVYEQKASGAGNTAPATTTTPTACSPVTATNKYTCCESGGTKSIDQLNACMKYYAADTQPPPLNTTSQAVTPVNGGNTSVATSDTTAVTFATQQQATSCSAIKFKTLLDIAIWGKCIIGAIIIPGIFTLAFVVFLWGVFKFVRSSDQKDKQDSKQFIYMGLIGLFVMVSVWGIIKIATSTLGLDNTVPILQTDYLNVKNASK